MDYLLRGLPEELHQDLKICAAMEGTTLKELIVRVLAEYVERQKG